MKEKADDPCDLHDLLDLLVVGEANDGTAEEIIAALDDAAPQKAQELARAERDEPKGS